jgi:hypothetical protein
MPSKEAGEMAKMIEAIHDLKYHREAWRNAIAIAGENQHPYDKSYWAHELKVFDRTFKALTGE